MFLFHPENSPCSQDILIFVLIFWLCEKTACYKDKIDFKSYYVTVWLTTSYIIHIMQYVLIFPKLVYHKNKLYKTLEY